MKSLVASQLVYIFSPLQTNHGAIRKINTFINNFLWNDKEDEIKRKIMINDYSEGELKLIRRENCDRSFIGFIDISLIAIDQLPYFDFA